MTAYALLFATAFVAALCLTPPVRAVARWAGVLDTPDGQRKRHLGSVPKLGGIAVFLSFYSCVWLASGRLDWPGIGEASRLASAMFFPSLIILLLGVTDDLRPVGPWVKIAVQLVAGLLIYYQLDIGIQTVANPFASNVALGVFSLPATLMWIILVTNAFNIVDGMDGLAAGVAFIALSCMFLVSLQMGHPALALMAAPLAGAVLGFLRYNFNPASIFLGDSGSLFLGFQLAVLSMIGSQKSSTAIAVAAPLFILALPIVEAATSTVRRFLTGRSILQPDSGHIHHQLIRLGFTPRRAAGMLYLGSAAFGLASLFIIQSGARIVGLIAVLFAVVTWIAIQALGYTEFAEVNSALRRFVSQRRIIQNSIVSRRLADDFLTAQSVPEAWRLLRSAARRLGFSYVELRLNSAAGSADAPENDRYAQQLSPESRREKASETSFAVALTGKKEPLGEVIFRRALAAPPMHSELPLLISAVARGLPRVLESCSVRASSALEEQISVSKAVPQHDVNGLLSDARSMPRAIVCPSCRSSDIHRSRSRSLVERIRKNWTSRRPHECGMCGWRGWLLPLAHPREEESMVLACEAPDLLAIDSAIANVRYSPAAIPTGMLEVEFWPSAKRTPHKRGSAHVR